MSEKPRVAKASDWDFMTNANTECDYCGEGVCEREVDDVDDGRPIFVAINGSSSVRSDFIGLDGKNHPYTDWLCKECAAAEAEATLQQAIASQGAASA